ncbi:Cytochrome c oxidase subunit 4 [Knufia fluminis]|uniref:Cytochrome c oxidase subunit 4, mitochondrial n=1 Tax=Knufia fluminis TaxID=191047 RepID=A0AAN8I538_9EURO|nr:Cytochrome c oxidase subunit 4 [Knufia fluminis]
MSVARSLVRLTRSAPLRASTFTPRRSFAVAAPRWKDASKYDPKPGDPEAKLIKFDEIKTEEDLLPPGAEPGTIPTDLEQATGLERLEILGKMQGIDIFDMRPLPSDRVGTFKDPIVVKSAGDELQVGCTGCPADSHIVRWLVVSRKRPHERCDECGSVYKMAYVGPPDDPHDDHHHHGYEEPKTMADFVKPDYWYR